MQQKEPQVQRAGYVSARRSQLADEAFVTQCHATILQRKNFPGKLILEPPNHQYSHRRRNESDA